MLACAGCGEDRVTPPTAPAQYGLSIRDFGAVGDGSADDTEAINRAFVHVAGLGRPTIVFFPPGTYRTTGAVVVSSPCVIVGEAATLRHEGTEIALEVRTSTVTVRDLAISVQPPPSAPEAGLAVWVRDPINTHDIRLARLKVTTSGPTSGIYIRAITQNVVIEQCTVTRTSDALGTAIHVEPMDGNTRNVVLTDNYVEGWDIGIDSGFDGAGKFREGVVRGNHVIACRKGLRTYHFSGVLSENYVWKCREGWYLDGQAPTEFQSGEGWGGETTVTGNIIKENTHYGVRLEEFHGAFTGNYVVGNGSDAYRGGDSLGIPAGGAGLVIADVFNAVIASNAIHNNHFYGVFINRLSSGVDSGPETPHNILVTGNTITNNGADGIRIVYRVARYISIAENMIIDNGILPDDSTLPSAGHLIAAGVRVNVASDPYSARIEISNNRIANLTAGPGYDGRQVYGITSLEPDGGPWTGEPDEVHPRLLVKGNVLDHQTIHWRGPGIKIITDNVLNSCQSMADVGDGDLFWCRNSMPCSVAEQCSTIDVPYATTLGRR
jgi:hypothetical protein